MSGFVQKQRQTIKFFDPYYAFLSAGSLYFFSEDPHSQKDHHCHANEKRSDESEDEEQTKKLSHE